MLDRTKSMHRQSGILMLKRHINMIFNVQRRATKLTHSLRNQDYNERLVDRRKKSDKFQMFKIISGQKIVN